jgi:dethiobiotin synthetase
MASGIFITGTDTGVGKTRFSSLLVRSLRAEGIDAVGLKPFCCGDRDDAQQLSEAAGGVLSLSEVNPVWLRVPASPFTASMVENRLLDLSTAVEAIKAMASTHSFLVVEGVGGWRVPLTQQLCMSQFAKDLGFPVLVVTANRLGAINHTQLTLDSIILSGLACTGVVLNEPAPDLDNIATVTNKAVLEQLLTVAILGELKFGEDTLPNSILDPIRILANATDTCG